MTTASTKAAAITVDEYERMIEDGTIGEDDPIELIEGRLVAKMTKKPDHMSSSGRARRAIESVLPSGWHARVEGPVRIPSRDSEPEPDLAVVRGEIDDYEDRHPDPADVAWSSKSRSRAWPKTASSPRPMEAGESPSTGSSISFPANSRSMPGRPTAATLRLRFSRRTSLSI